MVARFERASEWEVIARDLPELDITDPSSVRDLVRAHSPRWVVNTAAMTQVDDCETAEAQARAVNAKAVGCLAEVCTETNGTLVHLSTDYVFDGRSSRPYVETDEPNPISVYGRTKLLGEQYARSARRHLVIRTAWMYGPGGRNFVETILGRAASGAPLRVVNDQFGSPTHASDVAECVERLMRLDAEGVFHVTNGGEATWHELACRAIALAGLDAAVEPVTSEMYVTPAARPRYSVLDCGKYVALTGHQPREWDAALSEYVRDRRVS